MGSDFRRYICSLGGGAGAGTPSPGSVGSQGEGGVGDYGGRSCILISPAANRGGRCQTRDSLTPGNGTSSEGGCKHPGRALHSGLPAGGLKTRLTPTLPDAGAASQGGACARDTWHHHPEPAPWAPRAEGGAEEVRTVSTGQQTPPPSPPQATQPPGGLGTSREARVQRGLRSPQHCPLQPGWTRLRITPDAPQAACWAGGQAWGPPTGWPRGRLWAEGGGVPTSGVSAPQEVRRPCVFIPGLWIKLTAAQVGSGGGLLGGWGPSLTGEGGAGLDTEAGVPARGTGAAWPPALGQTTPSHPRPCSGCSGLQDSRPQGTAAGALREGAWEGLGSGLLNKGVLRNNTCALGGAEGLILPRCPHGRPQLLGSSPASPPSLPSLFLLPSVSLPCSPSFLSPVSPLTRQPPGRGKP